MKPAGSAARLWYWVIWLGCLTTVFGLRFDYLFRGFYIEDVLFLGLEYSDAQPGMYAVINSPADILDFFRVDRGWFYRPFFLLYIGGLHLLFGNDPVAFHAASLLLHGAVTALSASLVLRLTQNTLAAFFAAVLFLIWPEKEQATWWISSASTLLAACFGLICLHAWLWYRETGHGAYYSLSLVSAMLAIGSKNEGVCLVLLGLLMLEITARLTNIKLTRSNLQYVPFFFMAALYVVLERASLQSFPEPSTSVSLSARWLAMLDADITMGLSQRPVLLIPCVLAFMAAAKNRRALSLGLIVVGIISAKMLAFALGTGVFASRFYYAPVLFVACGLAVVLATGREATARFFFAMVVARAIISAFESLELLRSPFFAQSALLIVTIVLAFALKKRQRECERIYPLSVVAAFWTLAENQVFESVIVAVVAFVVLWVMYTFNIHDPKPKRMAHTFMRKSI